MRTRVFQYISLMILSTVIHVAEAQGQDLPISDTQNSGCLSMLQGDDEGGRTSTIILEKEGNILSVQLLNYRSNCGTYDFTVNSSLSENTEGSSIFLSINVVPNVDYIARCMCPFNVSFTVHDLEPNTFYLECWWYKGLVELTEGEPLVLKDVYETVNVDGMNYMLRKALHHAMVTKNELAGEVCLPSELNYEGQAYTVTSIDQYAFTNNTALTKVTIPRTITNMNFDEEKGIDWNPFIGCTSLESIEVEEENPVLCAVDGVLFNKEQTRLYTYPPMASRSSYAVPKGVTRIENYAFAYNHHLVNVSMPDEVTFLGPCAFYDCTNLEEVKLSSSLQTLREWMFWNCQQLKSITIPDGVAYLCTSLFSRCTSLTSVTMPASVTSTDYSVFENCTSLKDVTLSPNLERINNELFLNCSNLTEIQIPEGVTSVMSKAFQNCTALNTLDLPESVNRLGSTPFSGCKLESLYIRGIIESRWLTDWLFDGMGTKTKLYVQPSEVETYKRIYKGPVYPLPDETNGITDIIHPANNSSELFDLQGRRIIGEPKPGIYIINGQKRVMR